jgi:hypothetical protein
MEPYLGPTPEKLKEMFGNFLSNIRSSQFIYQKSVKAEQWWNDTLEAAVKNAGTTELKTYDDLDRREVQTYAYFVGACHSLINHLYSQIENLTESPRKELVKQ